MDLVPPQVNPLEVNPMGQGTNQNLAPTNPTHQPFVPFSNYNANWVATIPQDQAATLLQSRDKGVVIVPREVPITEKDILRDINRYLPTIEDIEQQQIQIEIRQRGSVPTTTNDYRCFEQTYNEVLHVRQQRRNNPHIAEAVARAELANLRKREAPIIQHDDSDDEDGGFIYGDDIQRRTGVVQAMAAPENDTGNPTLKARNAGTAGATEEPDEEDALVLTPTGLK